MRAVALNSPISQTPVATTPPANSTVLEIVEEFIDQGLSPALLRMGRVTLNGHVVSREYWHLVRPKPHAVVMVVLQPQGGGGDGAKSALLVVAAVALVAVTAFISAGALAPLAGGQFLGSGGVLGAGTIGAKTAAAAVGIAGSLAISAFAQPPTSDAGGRAEIKSLGAPSNAYDPFGVLPVVLGTTRITPKLLMPPFQEVESSDRYINLLLGLEGPIEWGTIKSGTTELDDIGDLEYETRSGLSTDAPRTLITDTIIQRDLSNFKLSNTERDNAGSTGAAQKFAQWHRFTTDKACTRLDFDLLFPAGLTSDAGSTRIFWKMRMRAVGETTWYNLPVLHCTANRPTELRLSVHIARGFLPENTGTSTTDLDLTWQRGRFDSSEGAGSDFTPSAPFDDQDTSSGGIDYGTAGEYVGRIKIPEESWPENARIEFEIQRGHAARESLFTVTQVNTTTWNIEAGTADPWVGDIVERRDRLTDLCFVESWKYYAIGDPVLTDNVATLAIRAKNVQFETITAVCTSIVETWNGAEWGSAAASNNPAEILRHALISNPNRKPVTDTEIKLTEIQAWHAECVSQGYKCGLFIDSSAPIDDVLSTIAATGFAAMKYGEKIGVVYDRDRSADPETQIFSPRNSRGFRAEKILIDRPDAILARFADEDNNYQATTRIVYDSGQSAGTASLYEELDYAGFTDPDLIDTRAQYDLNQSRFRAVSYQIETDWENLASERGDLVGLSNDVLDKEFFSARLESITTTGAEPNLVTSVRLDSRVENETFNRCLCVLTSPNFLSEPNIFLLAGPPGLKIRLNDGTVITKAVTLSESDVQTATFSTPFELPDAMGIDNLVALGPLSKEYRRVLVQEIEHIDDLTARLTLVPEASELFQ